MHHWLFFWDYLKTGQVRQLKVVYYHFLLAYSSTLQVTLALHIHFSCRLKPLVVFFFHSSQRNSLLSLFMDGVFPVKISSSVLLTFLLNFPLFSERLWCCETSLIQLFPAMIIRPLKNFETILQPPMDFFWTFVWQLLHWSLYLFHIEILVAYLPIW